MFRTRYFPVLTAVLFTGLALSAVAQDQNAADQAARHLAVLQSEAPAADKALACKGLAMYGDKECIPALAPLLADEQLACWARIALQTIPDPAADDALRAALDKLEGNLAIGVINSIAVRRDTKATGALIARLGHKDAEVAQAAAVALGRLAGPEAVKALETALTKGSPALRSAAAEGCILAAEQLQADGNTEQAVRLFDVVRAAELPKQRIVEATRGAILARGSAGIPLLMEQLRSADNELFGIGLRAARELAGGKVTEALAAELQQVSPERQVQLLMVVADRGDTAALPVVLQAAKSDSEEVRRMAVRALGYLGNASCVPMLLEMALSEDASLAPVALSVLADVSGEGVNDDIVARLADADGKMRLVLLELAGQRVIRAAVPLLLSAAGDPDVQVRAAALTALGKTIGPDHLPVLMERVSKAEDGAEVSAAVKALGAASQRMPDVEACAQQLVAAMTSAPDASKCRFLEVLAALGGDKALETVAAAASAPQPEMRETATRMLGEWMTIDAAPVLLDLAKNLPEEKYQVRALRGYIRLLRQFPLEDDQRIEMCRAALNAAQRDEERKLVLEVLQRYPGAETLRLAIELLEVPSLKDDAMATAFVIAKRGRAEPAQIQSLLAHMQQAPMKVEIVRAEYGAGKKVRDVTDILRKHAGNFPVIALPGASYNTSLGGDPAPNTPKELKIQYRINGKPGEVTLRENATIVLPMPE